MRNAWASNRELGFTLIEIVIAMTLLSITLVSLAAWTYHVARRSVNSAAVAYRTAALTEQVGRLTVLPFADLDAEDTGVSCPKITNPPFPHERCITVTTVSATVRGVLVVITPDNTQFRPESLRFERTRSAVNPFNTP